MKKGLPLLIVAVMLFTSVLLAGAAEKDMPFAGRTLRVHWAVFSPSDALQDLANKIFTPKTGIKVIVEQTPWSDFTKKYNAELIARGDAWDIIIGDSQDIGNGAEHGHYVELTDFVDKNGIRDKFTPESLSAFGEWPKGSGRMYGIPALTDPTIWAYRKDLFNDPKIKAGFKEKYGYELGIPKSWDNLIDIAEYFKQEVDKMYGVAVYGDNGYDSLCMFGETAIWCYGGDLGDFKTMQVKGIINSEGSIEGIKAYRRLYQTSPPGLGTAFFEEVNNAYLSGIVPMIFNYLATLPALANKETNPYFDDTGYFMTPPQKAHATSLGGQCMNVVKYAKKNHDIAIEFLKWWIQDETQKAYASYPGCFNGAYAILNDPNYAKGSPMNPVAVESVAILKDWWAVPVYAKTIRTFSETVGRYVLGGEGTAEEAMNTLAEEWHEIFEKAGYYK